MYEKVQMIGWSELLYYFLYTLPQTRYDFSSKGIKRIKISSPHFVKRNKSEVHMHAAKGIVCHSRCIIVSIFTIIVIFSSSARSNFAAGGGHKWYLFINILASMNNVYT